MGLRDRLRKLEKAATEGGVVVRLQDGGVRVFDEGEVFAELFLTRVSLFRDEIRKSEVLDALRAATPESRAEFLERFGFDGALEMEARVIASDADGGWVEVRTLLEDGSLQIVTHEGGSEKALRIRRVARESGPVSMRRG